MALNAKRVLGYGCLSVLTAPLWVPVAFVAYIGAKVTRFAFKHATPVATGLAIAGLATYAGCHYREPIARTASAIVERVAASEEPSDLERRVQEAPAQKPALSLSMIDEPDTAYYFVREGETLGRIAATATGNPSNYLAIARASRLADPDDVAVGTLLRIPQHLCVRAVPGLYDKVPSLNSLVLPAAVTISQRFGPKAQEVIAVNRALGLSYQDAFAYPTGERVVWFP